MDSQQKKETRREDGRQQRPYRRAGHDLQIFGFWPDRTGDERLAVAGGRARKEVAALLHIAADVGVVPQPIAAFDDRDSAGGIKASSEEPTSELQSLMRIYYADLCLIKKQSNRITNNKI